MHPGTFTCNPCTSLVFQVVTQNFNESLTSQAAGGLIMYNTSSVTTLRIYKPGPEVQSQSLLQLSISGSTVKHASSGTVCMKINKN